MKGPVSFWFLLPLLSICSKATCISAGTAYVSIRHTGASVSRTCDEPFTLLVDVTVGEVSETYTLNRMVTSSKHIPLFFLLKNDNGEKSVEKEINYTSQKGVQYTEAQGLMTVEMKCTLLDGNQHFEVFGFVTLSDGVVYKLEPCPREERNLHPDIHRDVYTITETPYSLGDMQSQLLAVNEEKLLQREKRDAQKINIDVVTLVGYSVYQRSFQRSIESTDALKRLDALDSIRLHFGLLFNSVARRFTSASSDYNIQLVGCVIEDEEEGDWVQQTRNQQDGVLDGNFMLESIWNWTTTIEDFPQNDVIVTYELMNLYSLEENKYLYDFSKQSSICTVDGMPVVLVRFRDLVNLDVAATAHGLGRAFGAFDDGPPNNCSSDDHFIMSSDYQALHQIGIYNPYYFSPCSIQYFQEYIDFRLRNSTFSRSCLLDSITPVNVTNVTGILPGEVYNPDDQCRLVYGSQSYYCFNQDPGLDHKDICKRLHCYYPADARCYPLYGAEGTTCGNKKWCLSGGCVYSDDAPSADDECVNGDQIYITGRSLTCPSVIASYVFYCYYTNIETMCCKSCKERRGPDEGCQYGDNRYAEVNCQHSNCNSTTTYKDTCCETCSDYRTNIRNTTSAAIAQLPTVTMPAVSSTTTPDTGTSPMTTSSTDPVSSSAATTSSSSTVAPITMLDGMSSYSSTDAGSAYSTASASSTTPVHNIAAHKVSSDHSLPVSSQFTTATVTIASTTIAPTASETHLLSTTLMPDAQITTAFETTATVSLSAEITSHTPVVPFTSQSSAAVVPPRVSYLPLTDTTISASANLQTVFSTTSPVSITVTRSPMTINQSPSKRPNTSSQAHSDTLSSLVSTTNVHHITLAPTTDQSIKTDGMSTTTTVLNQRTSTANTAVTIGQTNKATTGLSQSSKTTGDLFSSWSFQTAKPTSTKQPTRIAHTKAQVLPNVDMWKVGVGIGVGVAISATVALGIIVFKCIKVNKVGNMAMNSNTQTNTGEDAGGPNTVQNQDSVV